MINTPQIIFIFCMSIKRQLQEDAIKIPEFEFNSLYEILFWFQQWLTSPFTSVVCRARVTVKVLTL